MPLVTLTDLTIPSLKPVERRQVTYLDKTLKGFGVRVTEGGQKTYVLTFGPNRQRVKLGDGELASKWELWRHLVLHRALGLAKRPTAFCLPAGERSIVRRLAERLL
jgi:hypothetical protein